MAKKEKSTKKAEPKKEKVVKANPWDGLEGPSKHPDHFGKDIYVKDGVHGYFEDGVFIKV